MATLAPVHVTLKPLYDRILVRRDAAKKEYAPGIAVAEKFEEPAHQGTVIATGNGRLTDSGVVALIVKEGDRVIFGRHSGLSLPEELGLGKDLVVMREDEVTAIVSSEATS